MITFTDENGNEIEFEIIEETRIKGVNYILVTDKEEGDSEALILKDVSKNEEDEALYHGRRAFG